jgi:hypothetical protein
MTYFLFTTLLSLMGTSLLSVNAQDQGLRAGVSIAPMDDCLFNIRINRSQPDRVKLPRWGTQAPPFTELVKSRLATPLAGVLDAESPNQPSDARASTWGLEPNHFVDRENEGARSLSDYLHTQFSQNSPFATGTKMSYAGADLSDFGIARHQANSGKVKKKRVPLILLGVGMAGAGTYLATTARGWQGSPTVTRIPAGTCGIFPGDCRTGVSIGLKRTEPEIAKFAVGLGLGTTGVVIALFELFR